MKYISGYDRSQTHLFPVSLDQAIDPDNEVKLIDMFVDSLPIDEYGFKTEFVKHPANQLMFTGKVTALAGFQPSCFLLKTFARIIVLAGRHFFQLIVIQFERNGQDYHG